MHKDRYGKIAFIIIAPSPPTLTVACEFNHIEITSNVYENIHTTTCDVKICTVTCDTLLCVASIFIQNDKWLNLRTTSNQGLTLPQWQPHLFYYFLHRQAKYDL